MKVQTRTKEIVTLDKGVIKKLYSPMCIKDGVERKVGKLGFIGLTRGI